MKALVNQKDRIKVILTDGVTTVTGMLAAQLKELYDDGTLRVHALVNIKDFITNVIGAQKWVCSLIYLKHDEDSFELIASIDLITSLFITSFLF